MPLLLTNAGANATLKSKIEEQDAIEGFDSLVWRRTVRAGSAQDARDLTALGDQPSGYSFMVCIDRQAAPVICGHIYEATHTFQGLLSVDKPYKVRIANRSEMTSWKSGVDGATRNEGYFALIGVVINYAATIPPDVSDVSTAPPTGLPDLGFIITPPTQPYPGTTNVYPNGWVLDTREIDVIPGSTVCLVTENWVYRHPTKSGGTEE